MHYHLAAGQSWQVQTNHVNWGADLKQHPLKTQLNHKSIKLQMASKKDESSSSGSSDDDFDSDDGSGDDTSVAEPDSDASIEDIVKNWHQTSYAASTVVWPSSICAITLD